MDRIKRFEPLFGKWYAEEFIGAGSFGRVYKIFCEGPDGTRFYSALKHISIPRDDEEAARLRSEGLHTPMYYSNLANDVCSEINLMYKLRGHTNIVGFEDFSKLPKPDGMGYDIFIRMEYLTSLSRMISENRALTRADVIKLGVDICSALEVCEANRIIHRDIKPDNIFINDLGDYKLGDFGVARSLEKTTSNMSVKGTYNYMAPEVYRNLEYGSTCDIYSLGLVLYRFLNKDRLPFFPADPALMTADNIEKALALRCSGKALPLPCDAKDDLGRVILKACSFDPNARYSSASKLKEDLLCCKRGERPRGLNYGDTVSVTPAPGPSVRKPAGSTAPVRSAGVPAGGRGAVNANAVRAPQQPVKTPVNTLPSDKKEDKNDKTKRSGLLIGIIAAVVACGLFLALLLTILGQKDKKDNPSSASQSSASDRTEAVTNAPTEQLITQDYVTEGVFRIRSVSGGSYLGLGGAKDNGRGVYGFYLAEVSDIDDALIFSPVEVSGNTCRLEAAGVSGEYFLDAFNSTHDVCGADIWGKGRDIDQLWILEKQADGTYCIYLASDNSKLVTLAPSEKGDIVSVRAKDYSDAQKWQLVQTEG